MSLLSLTQSIACTTNLYLCGDIISFDIKMMTAGRQVNELQLAYK
jgi:hypothetical protein